MSASYPTSVKSFSTKNPGDTIQSAHIDDLQDEVTAIEQDLITGLPVTRGGTGNTTLTANRVLLGNGASAIAAAGAGTSGQVLTSNGASAPTFQDASQQFARTIVCGRLSLTSGTAVTTGDVTAATTVYFALHKGNQIGLYTGAAWTLSAISELSIAVPSTTVTMYDVFVDYNSGTPQLAVTAWTNDTTRATALTTQDGVLVKNGDATKRYVGSFRTTGSSGQTEDSFAKRFVWNYYNRQPREMRATDSTDNWTYTTATWRQARATATNQLEFIVGVAEVPLCATVVGAAFNSGGAGYMSVAVGLDSTSAPTAGNVGMLINAPTNGDAYVGSASLRAYPAVGYHYAAWLEYSKTTTGTTTWSGDTAASGAPMQTGISGEIDG